MPDIDASFLALPLAELGDAALTRAAELGCTHADVRVERMREAFRSYRDHGLESTSQDTQVLGLSVRVVHDGVWGFAAGIALTAEAAAGWPSGPWPRRGVPPLTPVRIELADEPVHADATWVSAYEVNPFDVPEADRTAGCWSWSSGCWPPGVSHTRRPAHVQENKFFANLAGTTTTQQRVRIQPQLHRGQRRRRRLLDHADARPTRRPGLGVPHRDRLGLRRRGRRDARAAGGAGRRAHRSRPAATTWWSTRRTCG